MGARCLPDSSSSSTCQDPELLARFWAAALGYVLEPPPEGFATWDDWRRDIGLPDSELGTGADSIIDPRGGPLHLVPCDAGRQGGQEPPSPRHPRQRRRLCDLTDRSVPLATRIQRVDAEARRLTDLGATLTGALSEDGLDHYAVGMKDPEGNEFDIN